MWEDGLAVGGEGKNGSAGGKPASGVPLGIRKCEPDEDEGESMRERHEGALSWDISSSIS